MSKKAIRVFSREFKFKIGRRMLAGNTVAALQQAFALGYKLIRAEWMASRFRGEGVSPRHWLARSL